VVTAVLGVFRETRDVELLGRDYPVATSDLPGQLLGLPELPLGVRLGRGRHCHGPLAQELHRHGEEERRVHPRGKPDHAALQAAEDLEQALFLRFEV
jgi:hypothetical protein